MKTASPVRHLLHPLKLRQEFRFHVQRSCHYIQIWMQCCVLRLFHVKRVNGSMVFDVQLIPQGKGRWAALLANGQLILTATDNPRSEVALALLRQGVDPRSRLVIRSGARIIADEMLGVAGGAPVICGDVDMIERDC